MIMNVTNYKLMNNLSLSILSRPWFQIHLYRLINGELNLDILPGEYLNQVISSYPAFSDSIFTKHPTLLNQSARTKLITVNQDPLMIKGIITVPRILNKPFGRRYIMRSCGWEQDGTVYTTPEGKNMILSIDEGTWWDPICCQLFN